MVADLILYKGTDYFRHRVILSILSGRPVRFDDIRVEEEPIGISEYEVSFLKLIDSLTNGTKIDISYTGTSVYFKPGIIIGGSIEHDCGVQRGIGYFLEAILPLAPFSKNPFNIQLSGITNTRTDISVDHLRVCTLPYLMKFGIEDALMKITKRGAPPLGGGLVTFSCLPVNSLKPIDFCDEEKIKRIRGISYSTRVSPQVSNRMVESCRSLLNRFIPDIYVYSDAYKGEESGRSPGYGLCLVAESTSGALLAAEQTAVGGDLPEDVGVKCAKMLLQQIENGGCASIQNHALIFILMSMCPDDIGKILVGSLPPASIEVLRDIKKFLGVVFNVETIENKMMITCVGGGFSNYNRKVS